jgi:predicted SAM-dependent methyltransferase
MRAARRWLVNQVKKRSSGIEISRYIQNQNGGPVRLNIGAQTNKPAGWLSVDIMPGLRGVYLDATDMSVVPAESFDAVLCEHMIEHVGGQEGLAVMKSIRRILKRGGVARFITPNLDRLGRAIVGPQEDVERDISLFRQAFENSPISRKYPGITTVDYVNLMFREWGHQYLYTRQDLAAKLKATGFSSVVETKPNAHISSLFEGAQGHGDLLGHEMNDLNAMAFEVIK